MNAFPHTILGNTYTGVTSADSSDNHKSESSVLANASICLRNDIGQSISNLFDDFCTLVFCSHEEFAHSKDSGFWDLWLYEGKEFVNKYSSNTRGSINYDDTLSLETSLKTFSRMSSAISKSSNWEGDSTSIALTARIEPSGGACSMRTCVLK
jgi:hypothetical protein